jgi:3-phenylpropionate/trans-cinnamate dioxygenase ferredoxin reductase subunit
MAGGDEPYRHVPYFFSDQFDLSINMLGFPTDAATIIVRGDMSKNTFTAFYVQNDILRAALMVNDDSQMDFISELIAASTPTPKDTKRLADPAFDLASLVIPRR